MRKPNSSSRARQCHIAVVGILTVLLLASHGLRCFAQRSVPPSRGTGFTLFGDVEVAVNADAENQPKSLLFDLLLYTRSGVLIDRQKIGDKGRYRFLNVPAGDYDLVVEFENAEVARTQIRLVGIPTDTRQDIALEWRSTTTAKASKRAPASVEEFYARTSANQDRLKQSEIAFDKRDYEGATRLLKQILVEDPKDFQVWSQLGTAYLAQNRLNDAEVAYLTATQHRPTFFPAFLNLGKLRLLNKDFEGAISVLTEAISLRPTSADANYFMGEAYLQVKKGSKAVGYLNEAAKLGRPDAHLRLATLYNATGMKDKAADEYEQFLKKRPDYKDRKTLEQYISQNKKQ